MYASNFAETLIKEATSPNWKRKIVQILDALSDTLCKETDVSEFIRIAHPNAKVMQAVEDACINSVVKHTHKELYSALGRVQEFVDLLKPMETTQNVCCTYSAPEVGATRDDNCCCWAALCKLVNIGEAGPWPVCKGGVSFIRNIELAPVELHAGKHKESVGITANNCAILAFKSCISSSLDRLKPFEK
uniref:Uncharacterized protein n=1 Tax=Glossina austeni TaxID=7395 RepID=A0A1A9VX85_GLOAU